MNDRIADIVESNLTASPLDVNYFERWLALYRQVAMEFAWTVDGSGSSSGSEWRRQ